MVNFNDAMVAYLTDIKIPVRISTIDKNGFPHVVSLWFMFKDNELICATSKFALIVDMLEKNPKCGFEVAPDHPPYCGIRGTGSAQIIEDPNKKVLKEIFNKYCKDNNSKFANFLFSPGRKEISIIISPKSITKWNFAKRMESGEFHDLTKFCP
jgi:nitroimidazol reductase NimA-like FMN-containing flavoprotein (pyridoxamine 5'-phosphate oxidase superfamily)